MQIRVALLYLIITSGVTQKKDRASAKPSKKTKNKQLYEKKVCGGRLGTYQTFLRENPGTLNIHKLPQVA